MSPAKMLFYSQVDLSFIVMMMMMDREGGCAKTADFISALTRLLNLENTITQG